MELQRWLADALLALEEPYRSAVILRHVDGLDSADIARRQGCSPSAARQRITRGLARLRAALDVHHGGRERWMLVLAPLGPGAPLAPGQPATAPLTVGATGGLVLGSKAILVSLAALAAVALVWLAVDRESGDAARGRAQAPVTLVPALGGERALDVGGVAAPDESARESLALTAPAPEPLAAPDAPPSDPFLAWLSGRVLDAEHRPIARAEVVVRRPEAVHHTLLDIELRRTPREVARGQTDEMGRFAFELERGIPYDVTARADEHGDERLSQRYAGEEVEIVLVQGYLVHGMVTRERDGAPIAAARVRVFQLDDSGGRERTTTTAADGSYRLRFTFLERATLEVTPREQMGSGWVPLEPGPDGQVRQDLVLADGLEVRGSVVDAESGAPIEGALVGEGWAFRRNAATDARGEYVMRGFGNAGAQELHARAPGYGKAQLASLPSATDGVMRVDFRLARGRIVRGRVLDPERRPLTGAYVAAVASEDSGEGQRTDWISGRTDAGGRFELCGLTPELRHALLASADGLATAVYDLPADELERVELELDDVVLARPAVVAGTVRDEHGVPLGDMEVILAGANHDRGRWRAGSELSPAGAWYVGFRVATTDAQGRFWFGALAAGDYRIHARRGAQPEGPAIALALRAGELREDFVLLYPRGEELRGAVVDAEGRGLAGVYVSASLRTARGGAPVDRRRAQATARTGTDGTFALAGLPPGTYRLDCHPFELESEPAAPWLSTSVDAESGGAALEITLPRGASIRGRLVDPSGAALVAYTILARSPASTDTPTASTDDEGAFVLEVPPGTVWDLEVHGAWQTDRWETVFHVEPGVPAPTRALELRVDPSAPGARAH
jgi:protocatechuate 3,4-dioxygenase beta subunit